MAAQQMRWYVMRAISGKEGKVKEYIDAQVAQGDYGDKVSQVLIPKEKYVDIRNGKRIVKERCHLPGYVLVECILAGEVQGMLRNTPNVLGFLGETKATDTPLPIREGEMKRLLGIVDEMAEVPEDVQIPFLRKEEAEGFGQDLRAQNAARTRFHASSEGVRRLLHALKLRGK